MLERKFRNRKIEQDDSIMFNVIRKMGYKEVSDFYKAIADGVVDTNDVLDKFLELRDKETVVLGDNQARSAAEFELDESKIAGLNTAINDDVLVIDRNLKGLDYQLAKCCSPIYGDDVFGFVTVSTAFRSVSSAMMISALSTILPLSSQRKRSWCCAASISTATMACSVATL